MVSSRVLSTWSLAWAPCCIALTRSSRVRRSARSSSMVSNSLASWANSSSDAGNSRSFPCHAPAGTTLAEFVQVAGARWAVDIGHL